MLASGAIPLFLCCIIVAIVYFWNQRSRLRRLGNKLNGPKPVPLFGNIFCLGPISSPIRQKFQRIVTVVQQYKQSVCRLWLGPVLMVVLTKAEDIEVLANSKELNKSELYHLIGPALGNGLLTAPAVLWKKQRKMMNPMFSSKRLDALVTVFTHRTKAMLLKLEKNVSAEEFDICHPLDVCTLEVICQTLFGTVVSEGECNSLLDVILRTDTLLSERLSRPWLYPDWLCSLSKTGKQQRSSASIAYAILNKVLKSVTTTRQSNRKSEDRSVDITYNEGFLPIAMYLQQQRDAGSLSDRQMFDEIQTLFGGGQETVAVTAAFAAFQLALNPEIQNRAVEEQLMIFGDSSMEPTPKDLTQMVYLERIIKETLRLYPVGPIFGRKLENDLEIDGQIIPAGANIGIISFVVQRKEAYYPEPLKFDPDRFLPENVSKRHPYAYFPFGIGRRNCIGQNYAMMELKVILSMLLREYVLLPGSKTDIEDDLAMLLILRPESGIKIRIEKRNLSP